MNPNQMQAMHAMFAILPIIALIYTIVMVIPYWIIYKKAGFSPWLAILMIVPLVNLVLLYVVAFSQWKVVPAQEVIYPATMPPPQI